MTERFMKMETAPGEWLTLEADPHERYRITTCDGVESASVSITLGAVRRLLSLFPELREAPNEK